MRESIIDALIWYAGALLWIGVFAVLTAALAGVTLWASNRMARNLMGFVRFATARYWVDRMEDEGLTVMQKEYRAMVAKRKPKGVGDFLQLNADEEARLREANQLAREKHERAP